MSALKPHHVLLALPLLIGLAHVALAQTPSEADCQNASDTPTINYCAGLAYEKADRALNQTYQQLQAQLSEPQQQKLTLAQRAWIEYRDRNCEFEARNAVGGTGYPTYLSSCLERMTKQRTDELNQAQRVAE